MDKKNTRGWLAEQYPHAVKLRDNIRMVMDVYNITSTYVAGEIGLCKRSFLNRMREPWKFTLAEVEIIAKVLDVDTEVLFGDIKWKPIKRRFE